MHELVRLRQLFPRTPVARLARLLGRSVDSVRRQRRNMLARETRRGAWTEEEDERLRTAWGALDPASTALVLSRTKADIGARARHLRSARRTGPWSRAEIALLKQLFGSRSDDDLEVCLSRSGTAIAAKARQLRLAKNKAELGARPQRLRMSRWTGREVALLRELYPRQQNLEIARRLGRSVTGIANKANQLGLSKSPATLRAMGRTNVSARHRG